MEREPPRYQSQSSCEEPYTDGGEDRRAKDKNLHQREQKPQGLLYFTRYKSIPIMVNALFGAPTSREFTMTELAEKAGLSRRTVSDHLDVLYDLGIINQIGDTNRFSLNLDEEITWKLRELDGLIKQTQRNDSSPQYNNTNSTEEQSPVDIVETGDSSSYAVAQSVRDQATSGGIHAD